jgi:hypothetical protein
MILRNAKELKNDYSVFASFYNRKIDDKGEYICRNVCDIRRKDSFIENNDLDAYFIMMNPGSCHPINDEYIIDNNRKYDSLEMIECNPDPAQYQIMKLMDNKRWKYVRILNLSDITTGDSNEFRKLLKYVSSDSHSVFSDSRKEELENLMHENARIVAAWTSSKEIRNLAILCKDKLKDRVISGIPFDKDKIFYKYIKPQLQNQRVQILKDLLDIL